MKGAAGASLIAISFGFAEFISKVCMQVKSIFLLLNFHSCIPPHSKKFINRDKASSIHD
jgi:hypothetical protein